MELLANESVNVWQQKSPPQEYLEEALQCLKEGERKLILEAYSSRLKLREVAEQQGKTPMALYKKLQKIRGKLVAFIQKRIQGE